ncbi:hypothetical protein F5B22DRAFT_296834 [Xylaria bambusicola]|uniref:uncharacterized protein n=1 Tax=Xylaria bambusicola TaxID=326684 RepID=UPI0020079F79|nr:uncharacterized protein F5B22DRAFT_296834 [Xylaria bambusicola]KAI0512829.1 hypothetical protein F5B22DRAFT_296834 [Xylaria bambusicola]
MAHGVIITATTAIPARTILTASYYAPYGLLSRISSIIVAISVTIVTRWIGSWRLFRIAARAALVGHRCSLLLTGLQRGFKVHDSPLSLVSLNLGLSWPIYTRCPLGYLAYTGLFFGVHWAVGPPCRWRGSSCLSPSSNSLPLILLPPTGLGRVTTY